MSEQRQRDWADEEAERLFWVWGETNQLAPVLKANLAAALRDAHARGVAEGTAAERTRAAEATYAVARRLYADKNNRYRGRQLESVGQVQSELGISHIADAPTPAPEKPMSPEEVEQWADTLSKSMVAHAEAHRDIEDGRMIPPPEPEPCGEVSNLPCTGYAMPDLGSPGKYVAVLWTVDGTMRVFTGLEEVEGAMAVVANKGDIGEYRRKEG